MELEQNFLVRSTFHLICRSRKTFSRAHLAVVLLLLVSSPVIPADIQTPPVAISIPPSEFWEGTALPWSTFGISIGTLPQNLHLLPSTSTSSIWPVFPEGCPSQGSPYCPGDRGTLFNPRNSTTWTSINPADLGTSEEQPAGLSILNDSLGFDNVSFRYSSENGPGAIVLAHEVIEGMTLVEDELGTFGLSPRSVNFSSSNSSSSSLLTVLKNRSTIPSLSWGYTAGASSSTLIQTHNVFGSLTLGGYDASRFVANNVTFPFGSGLNRELTATLRTITSNLSSTAIFSGTAEMLLDSHIPDLILPPQACDGFANTLGFLYNSSANRYYLNHTGLHQIGQAVPQLSFTIASPTNSTVTISIPLTAVLGINSTNVSIPYTVGILSIRPAETSSQFTLGRTFLQEAYLTADYERRNFSIAQAVFPSDSTPQRLITIPALPSPGPPTAPSPTPSPPNRPYPLTSAAIAAIVLGATFLTTVLILISLWRLKTLQFRRQSDTNTDNNDFTKPELHPETSGRLEVAATPVGGRNGAELRQSGLLEIHSPLDGEEMPTLLTMAAELPSPTAELDGRPRSWRRGPEGGRRRSTTM